MDEGNTTLIQKDLEKKNRPQQFQTHNVPIDDMENTDGTNIYYSVIRTRTVPRGTERMPQVNKRTRRFIIHQQILKESKTRREKCNYSVDYQQKTPKKHAIWSLKAVSKCIRYPTIS